jgi:lysophospholipase L1-like esterase
MKIYVIGDSISIGYGPFLRQYLDGVITYSRKEGEAEALLNLDKPQGANGGDSSMVLAFLKASAKTKSIEADLLLLNCGLHDMRRDPESRALQVPLDKYEQNLRSIISVVKEMRTTLVWIRTTPCDEKIHNKPGMKFHRFAADCAAYNAAADRVMSEAGVPAIDLFTFTRNLGPDLFRDHVHFHEHVCQKQAAFIAGWLDCRKSNRNK